MNRLAELSTWDEVALAIEFKELFDLDLTLDLSFDLAITGFSHPEIDRLTSVEGNAHEADDEVPEAEEAALVSRVGDLWLLRSHRLICGDARDPGVYERLMAGEFAAMGIHDAPYIEGKNILIESRFAETLDQLLEFAAELARMKVDVGRRIRARAGCRPDHCGRSDQSHRRALGSRAAARL